jgi:hypothetical protein
MSSDADGRPSSRSLDIRDDPHERVNRIQPSQRFDDAVEVQRHVLVNDHVAETWHALEFTNDFRRKAAVASEVSHRLRVVLEAVPLPGGEFSRDIDDELRDHQKREQHVVVQKKSRSST